MGTLVIIGIVLGLINLAVIGVVLHKVMKIEKTVESNKKLLTENQENIVKIVKILDIVLKKTKSSPLNFN